MTYPHFFAQPPGETSHCYAATLCFSTAAAAAPQSASHPRRPRRHGAALRCSERGRYGGASGDRGGWGRQLRPWPWFSGRFGSGSDEVMEGVRTLAGDFRAVLWDVERYSYLLFKDPLFG